MRWRVPVAGALVALVVAGCGVPGEDDAQLVPASEVPPVLAASPGATSAPHPVRVVVYLVEGERLVPQHAAAARRDVAQALLSLLTVPEPPGPRRSAVPAGTSVRRLQADGAVLSVDLSEHFAQARGSDQVLAVAQLVWTATEFPAVRRLRLLVDGRELAVPVMAGAVASGPVGRDHYRSVAPVR